MKISLTWLADYITLNPSTTAETIQNGLIQLGHEVEGLEDTTKTFNNVVVGYIQERIPHPGSDHLGICQVNVGETHGGSRQIVCGAPNARAGLTVAVALPGAVLPGDFTIKPSTIRGVESNGMICSQRELALGDEHNGIWEMETNTPLGTPLANVLGNPDIVMDVSVTPNRGDCLSHIGIARDLAALGLGTFKPAERHTTGSQKPNLTVATETTNCPLIHGLLVEGVKNGPSPAWVRARLEATGLRPKNILVDATNYVMLALGQPLHSYDAAKLKGGITARAAKGGETFKGLTGAEFTLREGDTVICDATGIVGLGGILGGESTAISDNSSDVFLEAAHFTMASIARTGQAHNVLSDARYRFERGVDPAVAEVALKLAAHLITTWGGGTVSAMVTAGEGTQNPSAITYSPSLCETFGGLKVEESRQQTILETLGFTVRTGTPWQVIPPTFRTYMANPEDLVEEILRVVGYETIPEILPPVSPTQFGVDGKRVELDRRTRKTLATAGFLEGITYSFISQKDAEAFAPAKTLLTLANPLAMDSMTTLRPSLIPGLLRAVKGNLTRKENAPKLAEVGKVYTTEAERLMAAGILLPTTTRGWRGKESPTDVFAAKGALYAVLEALGAPVESGTVTPGAGGTYHPGQSGTVRVGPFELGRFGMLHPATAKAFDLPPVAMFEIELEPLLKLNSKPRSWNPSPFPAVNRDVAFVLPRETPAAEVLATIKKAEKNLLKQATVFDVYTGENVPEGTKSLAIALTLQSAERTLAEADITQAVDAIVGAVKQAHNATLRM